MEFLRNAQGVCPVCGKNTLDYGDMEERGNALYYNWHCLNCNNDGEEWYRLEFDGHEVLDEKNQLWKNVNDNITPEI